MRSLLPINTVLLLAGCSNSYIVNHDFTHTVVYFEAKHKMDFSQEIETHRHVFPFFVEEVEIKKYVSGNKLKIQEAFQFLSTDKSTIIVTKANETQSEI